MYKFVSKGTFLKIDSFRLKITAILSARHVQFNATPVLITLRTACPVNGSRTRLMGSTTFWIALAIGQRTVLQGYLPIPQQGSAPHVLMPSRVAFNAVRKQTVESVI